MFQLEIWFLAIKCGRSICRILQSWNFIRQNNQTVVFWTAWRTSGSKHWKKRRALSTGVFSKSAALGNPGQSDNRNHCDTRACRRPSMNSPGRAQEAQTGGAFTITSHCFPKFDVDHPWQSISLSAKCAMTFPSRVLNYWTIGFSPKASTKKFHISMLGFRCCYIKETPWEQRHTERLKGS